jgi:DNA polymerase III alpha subunit
VEYKYPCLKVPLEKTLGVGVYEEQLMSLANSVAGWDLNKADGLRKLTKLKGKNPELAEKLKQEFIKDACVVSGLKVEEVEDIWENVISPFAGYGFNKCLAGSEKIDIYDKDGVYSDSVNIEDLYKSNPEECFVKSRDELSGQTIYVRVRDIHNNGVKRVYEFKLDNGKTIKCSVDHKFRVADGRMLPINQIAGEGLDIVCVVDVAKVIQVEYVGEQQCYDLEVEHCDHQFYLSSGLLTSNSHSIAYSINGYHTAYYKKHYPAAFMAAVLKSEVESNSKDRDDNIRAYKKEAKRLGLQIKPPNVNFSGESYDVADDKTIVIGLKAIKGLGESAARNILEARKERPFVSFADFLYRTDSRLVRKDSIQALAKAGAFDCLGITRRAAFEYYQDVRQKANKHGASKAERGIAEQYHLSDFEFNHEYLGEEWSRKELLQYENEVLGEYISGSINEIYDGFFTERGIIFRKLNTIPDKQPVFVEGIVSGVKEDKGKSGKNKGKVYARYTISDLNGDTVSMTAWNDTYVKYKDKLVSGKPFKAVCSVNEWNGSKSLVLNRVEVVYAL